MNDLLKHTQELVNNAVVNEGKSLYQIAAQADIDYQSLLQFMKLDNIRGVQRIEKLLNILQPDLLK